MSNEEKAKQESPVIKWDDKDMQTSYANVSNVAVTQDDVMMLLVLVRFGIIVKMRLTSA